MSEPISAIDYTPREVKLARRIVAESEILYKKALEDHMRVCPGPVLIMQQLPPAAQPAVEGTMTAEPELKRWRFFYGGKLADGMLPPGMSPRPDGEWVKWEDASRKLAEAKTMKVEMSWGSDTAELEIKRLRHELAEANQASLSCLMCGCTGDVAIKHEPSGVWICMKCRDGLTKANAEIEEERKDKRRLVRELDVIWNGDGAAKQASLCDVVGQIANELPLLRAELSRLRGETK